MEFVSFVKLLFPVAEWPRVLRELVLHPEGPDEVGAAGAVGAVGLTLRSECPWVCELTNDTGYVLYSAFGSFFIPMFVMLFFYWRIYIAAVETTRAINQVCTDFPAAVTFGGVIESRSTRYAVCLRRTNYALPSSRSDTDRDCAAS